MFIIPFIIALISVILLSISIKPSSSSISISNRFIPTGIVCLTFIILPPNFSVCATYSPSISNIDDLLLINAFLPTIVFTATDFPAPGIPNIAILAFANPCVNVSKFNGSPVNKSLPKYIPSFTLDFVLAIGNIAARPAVVIFLSLSFIILLFNGNVSFKASNCLKYKGLISQDLFANSSLKNLLFSFNSKRLFAFTLNVIFIKNNLSLFICIFLLISSNACIFSSSLCISSIFPCFSNKR